MNGNQEDRRPLLSQRGGVWYFFRWGTVSLSWPFATVTVFSDHFEVNGVGFTAQNVLGLERVTFLFWAGLRVVHSNPSTCKEIVFWSPNFALLRATLEQVGFSITGPSVSWRRRQWVSMAVTMVLFLVMVAIGLLIWGPDLFHSN